MGDSLLEENREKNGGPNSVCKTFVGTDGIMSKTCTMEAVKCYATLEGEGTILKCFSCPSVTSRPQKDNDTETSDEIKLPKIQCIIGTKSMEAGINGKYLEFAKITGLPSSFYELVQQLGRVDRNGTVVPGANTYEVHLDLFCYMSIYVRVMTCDCQDERQIQLRQVHEVLRFLLLAKVCYHTAMERYFEWETSGNKQDCVNYCSMCLGDTKKLTGRVNRQGVVSLLVQRVHGSDKDVTLRDLVRSMKESRKTLSHRDDVPSQGVGQIHALCLQLIAAGIISLAVTDRSRIGTDKMSSKVVAVTCPNVRRAKDGNT